MFTNPEQDDFLTGAGPWPRKVRSIHSRAEPVTSAELHATTGNVWVSPWPYMIRRRRATAGIQPTAGHPSTNA